jgi:hypothetical protein
MLRARTLVDEVFNALGRTAEEQAVLRERLAEAEGKLAERDRELEVERGYSQQQRDTNLCQECGANLYDKRTGR